MIDRPFALKGDTPFDIIVYAYQKNGATLGEKIDPKGELALALSPYTTLWFQSAVGEFGYHEFNVAEYRESSKNLERMSWVLLKHQPNDSGDLEPAFLGRRFSEESRLLGYGRVNKNYIPLAPPQEELVCRNLHEAIFSRLIENL